MTRLNGNAHGVVCLTGLGHMVETLGDQCCEMYLQEFESRLQQMLRPADQLIKLSTDKFCLVLKDIQDRHHLDLAAAKLQRIFDPPTEIIDRKVFFDVSAGFALPTPGHANKKTLLQTAESALRFAISSNQGVVIFDPDKTVDTEKPDPTLLPRLEQALEQGEFHLHYQVKTDGRYRKVVGAEGLVRWHDAANKEVVTPASFIDTVERSAMIKPLTEHLLRSAVARCVTWSAPLTVAVNIPPVMLESNDLVPVVSDVLDFYTLEPDRLILEITERGELPDRALATLEDLRNVGTKISIDDFGTGQCSLSYFRDLPADQVKIDQSFVRSMANSVKDEAIVRGSIDLAHHCSIQVVAEGVEDATTADKLTEMGCDVMQGYFFGKPQTPEAFERDHLSGLTRLDDDGDHFSDLLH